MDLIRRSARALGMLAAERGISIILALASVAIGLVQLAEPILFGRVVDTLSRGEAAFPYIALWALLGLFGILAGAAVAVFADRLSHRRSPRRGLVGSSFIPSPHWMVASRLAFYVSVACVLTLFGAWPGLIWYWLVPFSTWHIAGQYVRLICEQSAVEADEDEYCITRTTIPTWLESIFILPRNVGFHLEHH